MFKRENACGQKKQTSFNFLRKGVIITIFLLMIAINCFCLTGCINGVDGKNGAQWYADTVNIEDVTYGVNGDFYYDTDDYILYQKENGVWVLKVENFGKPGTNGTDGTNGADGVKPTISIDSDGYWVIDGVSTEVKAKGEDGVDGNDGTSPTITINSDGYWVIDGISTEVKAKGDKGDSGKDGSNGTNVYVGYDGYVWQDGLKTSFKLDQDTVGRENVVEDTIGAFTTMKYWRGEYVDLSKNTIALMANYKPNAKITQYGGTKVIEIQVVAESSGTLGIGTAKVADVVSARTAGVTCSATTVLHNVTAGVNTITLDLTVEKDETIIFGGLNSTAKVYVIKNLPVFDEQGNYALINGEVNSDVISKTGEYADTLAVSVRAETDDIETAVFKNLPTFYPESSISSSMYEVSDGGAPYKYIDNTKLSGKTITKIGVAVYSLGSVASDSQPYMTVYKIKKSLTSNLLANGIAIKVYFPKNTQVNTWAYADCNIELNDDETIAFGAPSGDTMNWAYSKTEAGGLTNDNFTNNAGNVGHAILVFDIYTKDAVAWDAHLNNLEKLESGAVQTIKEQQLKNVLENKNFSILGDSISTFKGYSTDNLNTNSTIGENAVYYSGSNNGISDVNETWWKQTADKTCMNVLVNNSYSGDRVTNFGQTRCEQLHDDTGVNAGTNPDVIAVYLGINDFDGGVSLDNFKTSYDLMIGKIVAKYNSADIYLFTLLPNNVRRDDAMLLSYNAAIREIAEKYGCTVVDLFSDSGINVSNMSEYTNASDCLHPKMAGMDKMTDCFWKALYDNYVTDAD